MDAFKSRLGFLAATAALLALPCTAPAAIVPPGNSAATQYTEAFPTARGQKDAERERKEKDPAQALGKRNAQRLESQGPAGRAAAALAAATAPQPGANGLPGAARPGGVGAEGGESPSGDGDNGSGARASSTDGSSGLGEVVAQATGSSSSDQTGLLLPIVVLGTILWSIAYLMRQRRKPTA